MKRFAHTMRTGFPERKSRALFAISLVFKDAQLSLHIQAPILRL